MNKTTKIIGTTLLAGSLLAGGLNPALAQTKKKQSKKKTTIELRVKHLDGKYEQIDKFNNDGKSYRLTVNEIGDEVKPKPVDDGSGYQISNANVGYKFFSAGEGCQGHKFLTDGRYAFKIGDIDLYISGDAAARLQNQNKGADLKATIGGLVGRTGIGFSYLFSRTDVEQPINKDKFPNYHLAVVEALRGAGLEVFSMGKDDRYQIFAGVLNGDGNQDVTSEKLPGRVHSEYSMSSTLFNADYRRKFGPLELSLYGGSVSAMRKGVPSNDSYGGLNLSADIGPCTAEVGFEGHSYQPSNKTDARVSAGVKIPINYYNRGQR